MKNLCCKNQENPSDGISHTWAPLNKISKKVILTIRLPKKLAIRYRNINEYILEENMLIFIIP